MLFFLPITYSAATNTEIQLTSSTAAIIRNIVNENSNKNHPLPLIASWHTGTNWKGFDPYSQLERIRGGEYLLPWFPLNRPDQLQVPAKSQEEALVEMAKLHLPISFISTQWEVIVAEALRDEKNAESKISSSKKSPEPLSPFGAVNVWYEAGLRWGKHPLLALYQDIYPDPPRVFFISNNEQPKLSWRDVQNSLELKETFASLSDESLRREVGNGWIERYRALQKGFRDGLKSPTWKNASVFVGYDALTTDGVGRWSGWMDYSLFVPERLEPWPLAWDGVSPSYYTPDYSPISDYQVMSPQIQAMNWVPYLEEAFRLNPSLWFELSVWDGQQDKSDNDKAAHYRMVGQRYDAQRYKGYVEFGMWLLRPRLLREFRDPRTTPTRFVDYFNSIADAVKLVHSDSVLRRFWQDGHLVPNTKQNHPYSTSLPERLKTTERWFLLDTAANPKRPWQLDTPLSVYALSLRTGVHPHQEWLIYAYSPLVDSIDTELQIPNGPIVTVTAKRGGCFTHIVEHSKKMDRIAC